MSILKPNQVQTTLTREQKEAVGLLSIGTFLEYFDLMLYVHMAVLLNELFFPKTDPHTAKLLSAFVFCSTFVFRPIGALLFGWIGDSAGRKTTVIITTVLMAVSCFTIANTPTYAEIGIYASWIFLACRVIQGMSSMGEIIGAYLYFTETIKPPRQYVIISVISFMAAFGGTAALGIATLVTSDLHFNWRFAFWIGGCVALVGVVARTALRETVEFIDAKRALNSILKDTNIATEKINKEFVLLRNISAKTVLALFFMECGWPICFYIAFIHCSNILRNDFGFCAEEVIHQGLIVSFSEILGCLVLIYLCRIIYPFTIVKVRLFIFWAFAIILPYILSNSNEPFKILIVQCFVIFFALSPAPALSICYSYIPTLKRFTYAGVIYAISRAAMYIVTSFGLVYTTEIMGHFGLLVFVIPILIGSTWGCIHFEDLEKESDNYPKNILSIGSH